MLRLAASTAVAIWLAASPTMTLAQNTPGGGEGTKAEQDACHRDAVRFCKDDIPDTYKVLICLQTNRTKLREPCRAVLRSHGVLEPAGQQPIDR